ncbi:MAG: hypothetical protein HRU15_06540 [Planctomycetes bacterium]|nr:hypothetical protein [Planctomycetota bacterium]
MKIPQLIVLVCCMFSAACSGTRLDAAHAEESDASLLDHIIAEQATLKTARGGMAFDIKYAEGSDRETESYEVKMTVLVPNKYRFAIKKDDQKELFISDGTVEWHVEIIEEDKFASKSDLKDGNGKFSHITKFLPLRRERLSKHFRMSSRALSKEEKEQYPAAESIMLLEPLSSDQKDHMKWTHIYFDGACQATCIKILDANKNLYDIRITEMEYNVEVAEERFTYEEQ